MMRPPNPKQIAVNQRSCRAVCAAIQVPGEPAQQMRKMTKPHCPTMLQSLPQNRRQHGLPDVSYHLASGAMRCYKALRHGFGRKGLSQ